MSDVTNSQEKVAQSLENMKAKLITGRNGVQLHIINVLIHAEKHNDIEGNIKATINCLDDLKQSQYAKGVMLWFNKFAEYVADSEGNQVSWGGAEFIRDNFQEAKKVKFWTLIVKEDTFKGFDLEKVLYAAIANATKAEKEAGTDVDKLKVVSIPTELMAGLELLMEAKAA
jgi:hypothetical protein